MKISNAAGDEAVHHVLPHYLGQNLPIELWLLIFVHCLPPQTFYADMGEPGALGPRDARLALITLTSVCRQWRAVACSTGKLWTTCWLCFNSLQLNTLWLERAGEGMLSLYGLPRGRFPAGVGWKRMFLSILQFQSRWEMLILEIWDRRVDQNTQLVVFDTPSLKSLTLIWGREGPVWIEDLLRNSPQLRDLTLYSGMLPSRTPLSMLSHQLPLLSKLFISDLTLQELLLLLSLFSQLEHVHAAILTTGDISGCPVITHTNLKSLEAHGNFEIPDLINRVTLPSLQNFRYPSLVDHQCFLRFVNRSGCRIKVLEIGTYGMLSEDLMTILQDRSISPWVEKFIFSDPIRSLKERPLSVELVEFLTYTEGSQHLPHLTHLEFQGCAFLYIPDGPLSEMVVSRCNRFPICQCRDCDAKPTSQVRDVRFKSMKLQHLEKMTHSLDVARLTPLPEDKQTEEKGASTIMELWTADEFYMGLGPVTATPGYQKSYLRKSSLHSSNSDTSPL